MSAEEKSKLLQKVDAQQTRKPSGDEEDECVVKGNSVALSAFYRIARNTMSIWLPNTNPTAVDAPVDPVQVIISLTLDVFKYHSEWFSGRSEVLAACY